MRMTCYCLHPGGQGMTKVLPPPEPGVMETGLECNATLPISPPYQPRGTGIVQWGTEKAVRPGRAGPCSPATSDSREDFMAVRD